MDGFTSALFFSGLFAGLICTILIIAMDKQRFLARFDLHQWREPYYLRALPNFLQALHDHHFATPWPAHLNAVSASRFRLRVRPLLKRRPVTLRRAFLHQHIVLFGLLETLRPFLNDYVLNKQQRLAVDCVAGMEDTVERDRLIAFVEAAREARAAFFESLTSFDRATLAAIINRRFIETLQSAHAIFQEHGYTLLPEFTQLRRCREMSGTELVQELPVLAPARKRSRRSRRTVA